MAGKFDIGPRIGIEGEREYKQALAEIVQGQKVMASELQLVSAKFAGQESSVEALTAKHDVLQRTLYGERERVETLQRAVANAAQTFGEGDRRTQEWQIKLNKAQAEEAKLEKQVNETSEAIQGQSKEMGNLGDVTSSLANKFGVQLPSSMQETLNGMGRIDAGSVALAGGFAAVVTAIVKVEGKLLDMTKEAASAADELQTLADKTSLSVETLQEYAYAADFVDVSVETITGAQTKLIRSMDSARDGAAAQLAAFEKLGVEYKNMDGTLRSSEDVFWDVVDALGTITNASERDAAAMDLLGKSAQELNPLIKAGSAEFRDLAKQAHDTGYVLSKDAVDALTAVDDAQKRLQKSNEALQNQIAAQFAPSAERMFESLTQWTKVLGDGLASSGIVEAFGSVLESVVGIIAPMGSMEEASKSLEKSLRPLAEVLAAIADAVSLLQGVGTLIGGLLHFNGSEISSGWQKATTALGFGYSKGNPNAYQQQKDRERQSDVNAQTLASGYGQYYANGKWYASYEAYLYEEFQKSNFGGTFEAWRSQMGYNAGGTDNWRGGLTWVGESGPELVSVPAGSRIYSAQDSLEQTGGDVFNITIDAKNIHELEDLVQIAKTQRMMARKGARR